MPQLRSFLAVRFPREIEDAVWREMEGLRREVGRLPIRVKWVERENLHLTLKFLGDVDEARLDEIAARLGEVASATAPFPAGLRGMGTFPPGARPRVFYAAVGEGAAELSALAARVEDVAEGLGFAREGRPFRAHLTIGRNKETGTPARGLPGIIAAREGFAAGPVAISAMTLMKSTLTPSGPIYDVLAELPFRGPR